MKVETKTFASPKGEIVHIKLTNASGASVVLSNLGAGLVEINVPDREGRLADVALGYADAADFFYDGPCAGKTPGRYANRIGAGRFTLDGKEYTLAVNNGPNHLHGGPEGFQNHLWELEISDDSVIFTRRSPDGEEGYPGNLDAKVTYRWDEQHTLHIDYEATTDAPTVVNLTNHTYFHLGGHNSGNALTHELRLNASRWLATDQYLLPDGRYLPVDGTPMDFRLAKPLGRDIHADFDALRFGKGYDNCWLIDNWEPGRLCEVATLVDPVSGRRLNILSDQPGAQVYTGNWLTGSPAGKDGMEYHDYDCVAIECQGLPDAPNKPEFPSQTLRPGETYRRRIVYVFSVE